jgi:hypothetical protein
MRQANNFYDSLSVGYWGLLCLILTGLTSCSNFNLATIDPNIMEIRNVLKVTDINTPVYIQGKVEKHAPLLKKHVYQLNDDTGKIWVLTNKDNLRVGSRVTVKGQLKYQSIPLAGRELGELYVEEQ